MSCKRKLDQSCDDDIRNIRRLPPQTSHMSPPSLTEEQYQPFQDSELRKIVDNFVDIYEKLSPINSVELKPCFTYTELIFLAIMRSPHFCLPIHEIYKYVQRYKFFQNKTTWKNAVRHSLSKTRCFSKIELGEKNSTVSFLTRSTFLWSLVPSSMVSFARGDYRSNTNKEAGANMLRYGYYRMHASLFWERVSGGIAARQNSIRHKMLTTDSPVRLFQAQICNMNIIVHQQTTEEATVSAMPEQQRSHLETLSTRNARTSPLLIADRGTLKQPHLGYSAREDTNAGLSVSGHNAHTVSVNKEGQQRCITKQFMNDKLEILSPITTKATPNVTSPEMASPYELKPQTDSSSPFGSSFDSNIPHYASNSDLDKVMSYLSDSMFETMSELSANQSADQSYQSNVSSVAYGSLNGSLSDSDRSYGHQARDSGNETLSSPEETHNSSDRYDEVCVNSSYLDQDYTHAHSSNISQNEAQLSIADLYEACDDFDVSNLLESAQDSTPEVVPGYDENQENILEVACRELTAPVSHALLAEYEYSDVTHAGILASNDHAGNEITQKYYYSEPQVAQHAACSYDASSPPSTTINAYQPPSTTINAYQPPSNTINAYQPPSNTINAYQPIADCYDWL